MTDITTYNPLEDRIITLRNQPVLLDSDVAAHYGVETRDINKAVKNNPAKFPDRSFIFELDNQGFMSLRWKFSTTNLAKTRVLPKAFTEKGLYMLATILKSEKATEKTIEIVETFANLKELARTFAKIADAPDEKEQKTLMEKGGKILTDLIDNNLQTSETETTLELNLAMVKLKHTVKRNKNKSQ